MLEPILIEANNPSPMTGAGNNTYLLVGGSGAVLIDAGVGEPRHLAALASSLAAHRAGLTDVLATHGHPDHVAGVPALASAHRPRFLKYPWPVEDARYAVDWVPLAGGETLALAGDVRLDVFHTGGHSPDHLVFWHEASRSAFSGDLVIPGGSVMIQWSRGGSLPQYLAALELLIRLDPATLYPGHGPAVTEPIPMLMGYLEHRRARERQVIAALAAGHSTVEAIADFIYDGLEPTLMAAARENVRAHLEKLRSEGAARCENDRWST